MNLNAFDAHYLFRLWAEAIAELPLSADRDKWAIALSHSTRVRAEVVMDWISQIRSAKRGAE